MGVSTFTVQVVEWREGKGGSEGYYLPCVRASVQEATAGVYKLWLLYLQEKSIWIRLIWNIHC